MSSTDQLPATACDLLHELRLRGLMPDADVDAGTADQLVGAGLAARKGTFLTLTPDGRAAHAAWARLDPGSEAEATARRAHDAFVALNAPFLQISTDWQLRAGNVPNDHTDVKYDWAVIDRLVELDERAGPVVRKLGSAVERFSGYRPRLRTALQRVQDGEHDWFLSPRLDSYHTVWMQLHEDLFLALGLDRATEEQRHST